MSLSDEVLFALALVISNKAKKETKNNQKHFSTREWHKQRENFTHHKLLNKLQLAAPGIFCTFLGMDSPTFEQLLQLVAPLIIKQDTNMRAAIPVEQRLGITLQYLATGNSYEDLKYTSAVSAQSIGKIVIETCESIITALNEYIKVPKDCSGWQSVANGFYEQWNFPNCVGALNGKHIAIKKPPHSGAHFYNYKNFFSVVLLAVVNSNYEFMMVDVGGNGRKSDDGVLRHTAFGKAFYDKALNLPPPCILPGSERLLPFAFIGDDTFQLTNNLMIPYQEIGLTNEQRVFNYRLNRARCVVENAFGILSTRFGVFQRAISLSPEKVQTVTLACCYLHNFLINSIRTLPISCFDREDVKSGTIISGSMNRDFKLECIQSTSCHNSTTNSKDIRTEFCKYFNQEGQVL